MQKQIALQTIRTNLFIFIWLFLTIFFVGGVFFASWMNWQDERTLVMLTGAVQASIQSIAMLTNTTAKGGNRLSDIGQDSAVESTTIATIKTETTTESAEPPNKTKRKGKP